MLSALLDFLASETDGWTGQHLLVGIHFLLAPITALLLVFVSAPYGRFGRSGWGPTVPGRLGWALMETPAVVGFLAVFWAGGGLERPAAMVLGLLWSTHYVHRAYIFPLRLASTRPMPVLVASLAFFYQSLNAPTQAFQIASLGSYGVDWLFDPRFGFGVILMVGGIIVNVRADNILMSLRRPGETGYRVPRGGLFRYVTCANYFGELVIWIGWAVATWSWAGLAFAVYTLANLGPRAAESHRWYHARFGDEYPAQRKRMIPFVW
ncbi:MAG: 3-oxo-5-alpha-steroid 4-dehydrogenase [Deltaproteobacteria bacterium]|nr:3-oxo-5-alpha-steroid 4-dehydrogenase [Deltaproteobacteria bacterium]